MSKQFVNFPIVVLWSLVLSFLSIKSNADSSKPLNTKDFYKQIYSSVCPSGELSCLREVMTGSFQLSLPRNRGEKVGSHERIRLFDEKENIIKTLSHNPPILEIEDFFTEEECELVIDLAKAKGMKKIPAFKNIETMFKDEIDETFKMWNLNGDGFVDANEVSYVYGKAGIFVSEQNVLDMLKDTKADNDGNGKLDEHEFENINKGSMENFFDKHRADSKASSFDNVFTEQTWLWHNEDELLAYEDLFDNYHERIAKLTKLPAKIIEHSEPIQVLRYENNAHYECHHDTQSISEDLPCCQYGSSNCRLCRYLTIMVYLTDDYEGGEKCFPFADNKTFSQKDLPREYLKKCNLVNSCNECNVLVKPKQGKAVMWYNHLLNTQTAWMGPLDAFSGQGDCSSRGEKWVANIWIDIIGDGKRELRSWRSGTNWIKTGYKDVDVFTALGNPDLKAKSDCSQFKERYSPVRNVRPHTNVKIGDVRLHFDNFESGSNFASSEKGENLEHSKILQSVLLLLNELRQDELGVVADRLKKRMSQTTWQ